MATYYVDFDTGADTNVGTQALPWKHCPDDPNATDTSNATSLSAGDTVIFKGGVTYFSYINCNWSGSPGNPITYDGNSAGTWGTGRAIITNNTVTFFNLRGSDYITIKNFELTGLANTTQVQTGIHSAQLNSPDYLTIQDNYFHNNGTRAMIIWSSNNLLFKDNEVSYHQYADSRKAIDIPYAIDPIIEGNYFHNNGVGLVYHQGDGGIIRYNKFEDNYTGSGHDDHFQIKSSNVDIYCNIFIMDPLGDQSLAFVDGGTNINIWSNVLIGFGNIINSRATYNVKIYNNSFYVFGNSYANHAQGGSDLDLRNNAFHAITNMDMIYISNGSYTGNYNIFYNPFIGSPRFSWFGVWKFGLSEWQTASGQDANSINQQDPKFNSPTYPDYDLSLQNDSPAIDAGLNLGSKYAEALVPGCTFPNPETTTRSDSWDMGAYIYAVAGPATQVAITSAGADFNVGNSTTLTVQVQDVDGYLVSSDNTTNITFSPTLSGTISGVIIGTGDGSYGVVGGAETVQVDGGVVTITLTNLVAETFEVVITNDQSLTNPSNDSIVVSGGITNIFTIDAETGNTSQWTTVISDTGNTFTADVAALRSGSYGFNVAMSNTLGDNDYGSKTVSGENEIYLKFYIYIPTNSYPMYNQTIARGWVISHMYDDLENVSIASLEMQGNLTNLQVYRLVYATNTQQFNIIDVSEVLTYDTWHSIAMYTKIGSGDGIVRLWIDDTLKAEATGLTNDNYEIESIITGCLWASNYTATGEYIYLDDITADDGYIGGSDYDKDVDDTEAITDAIETTVTFDKDIENTEITIDFVGTVKLMTKSTKQSKTVDLNIS